MSMRDFRFRSRLMMPWKDCLYSSINRFFGFIESKCTFLMQFLTQILPSPSLTSNLDPNDYHFEYTSYFLKI